MRTLRTVLVSLLGVGAAGAAPAQAQEAPSELLGCYDVTEGAWAQDTSQEYPIPSTPPHDLGVDSMWYQVPPRIELIAEMEGSPRVGGPWVLATPRGALPAPHWFTSWTVRGDSLRLGLSTGLSGVEGWLLNEAAQWVGVARTFSDNVGTQPYVRRIALERVGCDSPPPVPIDAMRVVTRSVELVDGTTITLGEPLPRSLETMDRPSGAMRVFGTTTGLFASTDSIVVLPPAGPDDEPPRPISLVQMRFAPPLDRADTMRLLTALLGDPDSSSLDANDFFAARWASRTTTLRVRGGPGGISRISMSDPRIGPRR